MSEEALRNHNQFRDNGVNTTSIMIKSLKDSKDIKDERKRALFEAIEKNIHNRKDKESNNE